MNRFAMVLALVLSACATTSQIPPAARSELAPTGTLRVGINVQNFLLVNKERVGGEYSGIAVDLGRELGRRLGVPVELVAFDTAGTPGRREVPPRIRRGRESLGARRRGDRQTRGARGFRRAAGAGFVARLTDSFRKIDQ